VAGRDGRFSTVAFLPILRGVENGSANGGPRSNALRVLLVEDNDVFREALELLLAVMPDIHVVGSVADGAAAVTFCEESAPDVVLMDYRLPGMDGVEATAAIRAGCDAAVVVLTATADPRELAALQDAGAAACLTKDSDLTTIVAAIRTAAARGASLV
jgi:DNA-binding NarL/FixJ family response regulator